MTSYGGAIAACGLAQGMDLPASVAPFILRGVSLLGIDSVMAPKALRLEAWRRLAADLDHAQARRTFDGRSASTRSSTPDDAIVEGQISGRVVVDIMTKSAGLTARSAKIRAIGQIFSNL